MFVTAREITETLPDGGVTRHPKGTILDRFGDWDYAVQKALLRRGDVTQVIDATNGEELATAAPAPSPEPVPVAVDGITCPHCPDRLFVNRQGLKLHLTRMHPLEGR